MKSLAAKYFIQTIALTTQIATVAISRIFLNLAATGIALLGEFLERRDHRYENLKDDRRRNIWHDPKAEDRALAQVSACKELKMLHQVAKSTTASAAHPREHRTLIHARNRNIETDAIDPEHSQRKQNLVTQLRNLENIK